jgi:hypothetical protein
MESLRSSLFPVIDQAGVFLVGDLSQMPAPPPDAIGIVFRDATGNVVITCYVERQRVNGDLWERAYQYLNLNAEPIAPRPASSPPKLELLP